MRITIEPTGPNEAHSAQACHTKVTVEHPWDDVELVHAFELCANALKAWGYSSESIDRFMAGEDGQ